MKRPYTDARKAALARNRVAVFNQWKARKIDYAANVPPDTAQRADEASERIRPLLKPARRFDPEMFGVGFHCWCD